MHAPGDQTGALADGKVWLPARRFAALARYALSPSISGSRADLERLTVARIDAGLLLFVLSARMIHLSQAAVDLTIGASAYTHPLVARLVGLGCVVESLLLSVALVRRGRLTLPLLLADTAFGIVGLGVLSFATTSTVGRTGTIDWMLPYTVLTATALGLLAARGGSGHEGERSRRPYDWRGGAATCVLAVGYAASVSFPRLVPGERTIQVIGNAANYLVFYIGGAGVSVALRRQLSKMAEANDAAKREAGQVAEEAQWRVVAVDVFGPVLDLLDRAATMGDEVPGPLRHEAGRLIELIEATNPGAAAGTRG